MGDVIELTPPAAKARLALREAAAAYRKAYAVGADRLDLERLARRVRLLEFTLARAEGAAP